MNPELYKVLVLSLVTASVSLTITKARVFESARKHIAERSAWFGKLVSCTYCTSHWVALALVAVYQPVLVQQWIVIDFFVSVFSVVAIAVVISSTIIRLNEGGISSSDTTVSSDEIGQLRAALQLARQKIVELDAANKKLRGQGP